MPLFLRMLLVTGPLDEVARASRGHAEQLERLEAEGRLHFAGSFADGDGFVEVLRVADRHEAERWTRASPLVERGLTSWSLREWVDRRSNGG